jgi:hypothetical protein
LKRVHGELGLEVEVVEDDIDAYLRVCEDVKGTFLQVEVMLQVEFAHSNETTKLRHIVGALRSNWRDEFHWILVIDEDNGTTSTGTSRTHARSICEGDDRRRTGGIAECFQGADRPLLGDFNTRLSTFLLRWAGTRLSCD